MGWHGDNLRERGLAAITKAEAITAQAEAENRPLSAAEQAEYDQHIAEARDCVKHLDKARDDAAFMEQVKAEFPGELIGPDGRPFPKSGAGPADSTRRLSFKGMAGSLARSIRPDSSKALAPSGATVVGTEFTPDPVALGKPALSLLDVLPVVTHSIPEFSYIRQTVRTSAAAVVAAGALKPTSVYSITEIANTLAVIAHLSEPIPRHWLLDNTALEAFLRNELEYGLQQAVEVKVLTDVNGTSGIQTQAYATSVLATLRKGITKLETAGYTASAFVLTPADWEGVELALSSVNAIEHLSLPYDPATRRLFGVPVTTSNAQAAGVGHVLASGAVALDTDDRGIDVQWSENATADSFGRNQTVCRCESRYATSVFSPLGVVSLDLTP